MNRERPHEQSEPLPAVESLLRAAADFEPITTMPLHLERRALECAARRWRGRRAIPLLLAGCAVLAAAIVHRSLSTREQAFAGTGGTHRKMISHGSVVCNAADTHGPRERSKATSGESPDELR